MTINNRLMLVDRLNRNSVHRRKMLMRRFVLLKRSCIDRSDLVICYVERKSGGAYKSLRYAEKHGKTVINLALPYK